MVNSRLVFLLLELLEDQGLFSFLCIPQASNIIMYTRKESLQDLKNFLSSGLQQWTLLEVKNDLQLHSGKQENFLQSN